VRLRLNASPEPGRIVTVRVRETIELIEPSDPEFSRLFPADHLRVAVR
jgi:hypothetical protein